MNDTSKNRKEKVVFRAEGKPHVSDFDKSYYTDDQDVPALYIGEQIIAIGSGFGDYDRKGEDHLRWKLDPERTYVVVIREKAEPEPPANCEI